VPDFLQDHCRFSCHFAFSHRTQWLSPQDEDPTLVPSLGVMARLLSLLGKSSASSLLSSDSGRSFFSSNDDDLSSIGAGKRISDRAVPSRVIAGDVLLTRLVPDIRMLRGCAWF
jgi:hypothetical protein